VLTHNYDKIFQELRTNSDIQITRSETFKVNSGSALVLVQIRIRIQVAIPINADPDPDKPLPPQKFDFGRKIYFM
jgi:hypothetical protein